MAPAPILHFNGRFRFQMPERNNDPATTKIPFDPNLDKEQVIQICGCDPAWYYEFDFFDTTISQVTYLDGTSSTNSTDDPIIGQGIRLTGFLPDVSPSAICARLYAGRLRVGTVLRGDLSLGVQSDLRLSLRSEGFGDETAAAHYEQRLKVTLLNAPASSRYFDELGNSEELEVYFHVNHYTRVDNAGSTPQTRLTGDVYGYIRKPSNQTNNPARILARRLVAHPGLGDTAEVEQTYLTGIPHHIFRIADIDGQYDIFDDAGVLCLRYLDFIPFQDRNHTTPAVDHYDVYFTDDAGANRIEVGRFVGNHAEMMRTGGLHVFKLPDGVTGISDFRLAVDVVRNGEFIQPLMLETEWDLVLESGRGQVLPSGGSQDVVFRVYKKNRPAAGHRIRLSSQSANRRSPIVAVFSGNETFTDADGRARATIAALDLLKANGVSDPVTGQNFDQLPWDRFYGNYVYAEIDNPLRRMQRIQNGNVVPDAVEQIELPVRVLHAIEEASIPETPTFTYDIVPLFSYYVRYFPWLHVREIAGEYAQILDIESYDSVVDNVDTIIERLELADDQREKMPRSRDFPFGGVEVLKKWRDQGFQQ